MTREEAIKVGFPVEWLPTDLTVEESKINRCDNCHTIIMVAADARWRLECHPIRCDACAQELIRAGHSRFESYFVV
jgi:hypothetical protein